MTTKWTMKKQKRNEVRTGMNLMGCLIELSINFCTKILWCQKSGRIITTEEEENLN